ncbi:uncharacterized protein SCHCODRAFT_02491866 [Schizophyllum commune H4-8]|nr:uncharacterized protein SCHCODRAFT_02491866 [Schizophyllum commune H4-8]KAI5896987.1 hypothetical protein SCHCODRAFT_02491866 [Schizophyllum commune H4-8]
MDDIKTTEGGMSLTSSISSGMRSCTTRSRREDTPMSKINGLMLPALRLPATARIGDPTTTRRRAVAFNAEELTFELSAFSPLRGVQIAESSRASAAESPVTHPTQSTGRGEEEERGEGEGRRRKGKGERERRGGGRVSSVRARVE